MSGQSESVDPIAAGSRSPEVPITDVLSRAGHELAELARLLDELQILINPFIQEAARGDPYFLNQIQSFDHIGQKVTGLADFLAALALAAPRGWQVDAATAARTVMLADLSSRLAFTDDAKGSCSTAWGDYEIF